MFYNLFIYYYYFFYIYLYFELYFLRSLSKLIIFHLIGIVDVILNSYYYYYTCHVSSQFINTCVHIHFLFFRHNEEIEIPN